MSLLQETLNEIEAEAAKKTEVVFAHADRIFALESLVKMLREHGAEFVRPCMSVHSHYPDAQNPDALTDRIIVRSSEEYQLVLAALLASGLAFATGDGRDGAGRKSIILRPLGMSAYIECFDSDTYKAGAQQKLAEAA